MPTILGLSGLILGAWAVRGICMQEQSNVNKLVKSVIAAAYFLGIGGLGGTQEDKQPIAIALLLIGAALVWYLQRAGSAAKDSHQG